MRSRMAAYGAARCSFGGVAGTGGLTESVGSAEDVEVPISARGTAGDVPSCALEP